MKHSKHIKFRTQLNAAFLATMFAFLFVFSVFFYRYMSKHIIRQKLEVLSNSAYSLQESVEESVKGMDTVSVNINYSSIVKNTLSYDFNLNQSKDSYKALADLFVMINGTDSRVDYIYLYDLNNNCLQVDTGQKLTYVDIQSEPWYKAVMENNGALYISAPYSKKTGNYTADVISLYRTYVNSNKQTVGIIETVKQCKRLFHSVSRYKSNTTAPASVYIYNQEGDLIYPYGQDAVDPGYDQIDPEECMSLTDEQTTEKLTNPISGDTEYLTSLSSSYTGWVYYIVQDEDIILQPLHAITKTLLLFVLFLAVCSVLISNTLSGQLVKPIKHLKHVILRMELSTLGEEPLEVTSSFSSELEELYDSFTNMNIKLKESRDQLIALQKAELEARTFALQSQINPHFYYNSLSSIMILAENGQSASIVTICQNLSHIMRYVTDFQTQTVTIGDEITYIREYLYCMKVRNQSSLNYVIDVPEALLAVPVPKLCLQPIVENALKYGTNCDPPWFLYILGEYRDAGWRLTVTDNGPGFTAEALEKLSAHIGRGSIDHASVSSLHIGGLGLVNLYIRLSIYFQEHFLFEYGNNEDGHAVVTIGAYD